MSDSSRLGVAGQPRSTTRRLENSDRRVRIFQMRPALKCRIDRRSKVAGFSGVSANRFSIRTFTDACKNVRNGATCPPKEIDSRGFAAWLRRWHGSRNSDVGLRARVDIKQQVVHSRTRFDASNSLVLDASLVVSSLYVNSSSVGERVWSLCSWNTAMRDALAHNRCHSP